MSLYLKIQDAVDGKCGSVYLTISGRRFEVPGVQKIEAHDTIKERTMSTVGTVKTQTAMAGVDGAGTMSINYYAVAIFGEIMEKYRRTGQYEPFDLLIINEDPATSLGRRSVAFTGCVLTGNLPLASLDATTADSLTMEVSFKYEDYTVMEDFGLPQYTGREDK
ncbi:MAG: phage tail tube protein [Bacillota bacterium]|jgi:hypothetical protein